MKPCDEHVTAWFVLKIIARRYWWVLLAVMSVCFLLGYCSSSWLVQ